MGLHEMRSESTGERVDAVVTVDTKPGNLEDDFMRALHKVERMLDALLKTRAKGSRKSYKCKQIGHIRRECQN